MTRWRGASSCAAAWAAIFLLRCGSEGAPGIDNTPTTVDAGTGEVDAKGTLDLEVNVVLVNGLTSRAEAGITDYLDVRVCFGTAGVPVPQSGVMPLSNYPGVARGRGVDLGAIDQVPSQGSDVYVFDAQALKDDTASCATLTTPGAEFKAHQTLKLGRSLEGGRHYVLVLTDVGGVTNVDVQPLADAYGGTADGGSPTPISAQFAAFSSWPTGTFSVELRPANAPATPLVANVSPKTVAAASVPISIPSSDYDAPSLAFVPDGAGSTPTELVQTLSSIQYVSDPTTSPLGLFDRRQSFVFVAIGDPGDLSALASQGHNAGFEGSGLHIIAVPYE